ncbi:peptide chain release factor N(5)-glutamine methyltransferase [uncultured Devosia sp.]|uniref:peptide chain release factor N(5)-glutamine methyltransferase n=1 Tax=uncultured Devosia sp. TaxID=211434 RepID=UPI0035CAE7C4
MTIGALWRQWRDVLGRLGFDSAALDAKRLTAFALGLSDLEIATREGEAVDDASALRVAELLQRRLAGESVARIVGEREFYGLAFALNAATLEPRPETEMLVDLAIGTLPAGGRLLDLGTGTGAIAVSVLVNRAEVTAVATDLSAEALAAARGNAQRHGVGERIEFLQGSWFEPLTTSPQGRGGERFDLVVSNPPYIASVVVDTLASDVRDFDPRLALDGGPDGLAPYRTIARGAAMWLKPRGQVMVEIGFDQGAAVSALLTQAGFGDVAIHQDLAGLDRVAIAHHIVTKTRTAR